MSLFTQWKYFFLIFVLFIWRDNACFRIFFRVLIDWHHPLIHWHHSPDALTPASQIRKELFVKQKSLHHSHARCTHNALKVLQNKNIVDLLSWSSAFDPCKNDPNRAIFDVGYQVWNESFLKLFWFWCSSASGH